MLCSFRSAVPPCRTERRRRHLGKSAHDIPHGGKRPRGFSAVPSGLRPRHPPCRRPHRPQTPRGRRPAPHASAKRINPGRDPSLVFAVPSRRVRHKARHQAQELPAASRTAAPPSLPSFIRSLQICIIPAQAKNNISPLHAHFIPNYHSTPLRHKEFPRSV